MGTLGSYFGDVHATILRQHAEIRAPASRARGGRSAGCSPLATVYLRVSLFRLAVFFESHLLYEEQKLEPRIRGLEAGGAARAAGRERADGRRKPRS